ncbi:hypothetical protein FTO68_00235 [Methanocalculus taiwanensis]|uniref:Uncharacterized protein n=1 Tax=Methanocalculus taiwanensis TaxID=106207 RepID=A0ABD4TI64_9EURY|nr:hypothetical protein [Methanocalculus taiwanensis]MCQ1537438.1 hypothetical protein [Methanocalculus taiwanensis]
MFRRGAMLIAMLFFLVSSAGAFFVESADGVPEGYLVYDEEPELEISVTFPDLDTCSFPSEDTLELWTGLSNPGWTVEMHRSGGVSTLRQSSRSREKIPGWELSYPSGEDIGLTIRLSGTVPRMAEPGMATIISIRQLDGSSTLRGENEYLIMQMAYPEGSVPASTPPDPVAAAPPYPDLSAFTVSQRSTTPTGSVSSGEEVTIRTYLSFDRQPKTSFPVGDTLRMRTTLIDADWEVSIFKSGGETKRLPKIGYYYTIPGFELSYPVRENLGLSVAVTGTVPVLSAAPLLEITQCGPDGYTREGGIFTHPACISGALPTITPSPTETPIHTPVPSPDVTLTPTPEPTPTITPLPPPQKGEIFSDGISFEGVLDLIQELVGHGMLFVERISPLLERIAGR